MSEIRGYAEAKRKIDQVIVDLHGEPVLRAFREATMAVANDAKRLAPVNTGRLRSSIVPDVRLRENVVEGVVGSNVKYAPYLELGTGIFAGKARYFPPPRALETWARRHGTSGYAVAYAIWRRGGTQGKRFMQQAFEENEDMIRRKISAAVQLIVDK